MECLYMKINPKPTKNLVKILQNQGLEGFWAALEGFLATGGFPYTSKTFFKRLWGGSWAASGRFNPSWGRLGASWENPGGVLGLSWGVLEASWSCLGGALVQIFLATNQKLRHSILDRGV